MQGIALTIRQPFAAAIFHGGKDVENRSWSTKYRGPLFIHVGSTVEGTQAHAQTWARMEKRMVLTKSVCDKMHRLFEVRGAVIGTVDLVDCVKDGSESPWAIRGEFHWVLSNPRLLRVPKRMSGRQGLWKIA